MASGDPMVIAPAASGVPPSSNFATLARRNNHILAEFDAAADESLDFEAALEGYGGGGLTLTICWMAATATTGNVVWNAQIERHEAESANFDADGDGFAAAQAVTDAAPATSAGRLAYAQITFTSGAQMDSLADGEAFRLRVTRDADNASDTMAGDAQLSRIILTET